MFRNREEAAHLLADKLKGRELCDPVVLAIPRGGVVIGAVLAHEIGAELDVILSRKLRAPWQPELALGAIAEDGQVVLNTGIEDLPSWGDSYLAEERDYQLAEIARRKELFRGGRPPADVAGRSVIVTDDGIATGATMIAALQTIRAQDPYGLMVAVPVISPDRIPEICRWCDELVYLDSPEELWAIGQFYKDFRQVEDRKVLELLRQASAQHARS
jgi:predicted phosphoribosyltransferase